MFHAGGCSGAGGGKFWSSGTANPGPRTPALGRANSGAAPSARQHARFGPGLPANGFTRPGETTPAPVIITTTTIIIIVIIIIIVVVVVVVVSLLLLLLLLSLSLGHLRLGELAADEGHGPLRRAAARLRY